jgi:hypothetical protein
MLRVPETKDNDRPMAEGRKALGCMWLCCLLTVGSQLSGCAFRQEAAFIGPSWQPPPEAVAQPPELPPIGKWMLDAQYEPAHWLGELYGVKHLREPINIVIVDTAAQSAQEARRRLLKNFAAAGYTARKGHTTGYRGYIEGVVYEQLPDGNEEAFSNEPFELGNNHGRMFGPHPYRGGWLFIGAFSREKVDLLDKVKHRNVSFNQARDDLSQRLDTKTDCRIKDYLDLDNALIGDPVATSGDHDSVAVLMTTAGP